MEETGKPVSFICRADSLRIVSECPGVFSRPWLLKYNIWDMDDFTVSEYRVSIRE